jgi:transcriptional regulator with XRE-family HTH domain
VTVTGIGRGVRRIRIERGLTMAEAGALLGVHTSTVSRIESGERRRGLAHDPRTVAALLDVTPRLPAPAVPAVRVRAAGRLSVPAVRDISRAARPSPRQRRKRTVTSHTTAGPRAHVIGKALRALENKHLTGRCPGPGYHVASGNPEQEENR